MSSISSSLKGKERRSFDAGYDARQRASKGMAKITVDLWPIISAGYAHLFQERTFLTSVDYWRERQRQADRECGPESLAAIEGSNHYLSLELILANGEFDAAIEIRLSDNFAVPPETLSPKARTPPRLRSQFAGKPLTLKGPAWSVSFQGPVWPVGRTSRLMSRFRETPTAG